MPHAECCMLNAVCCMLYGSCFNLNPMAIPLIRGRVRNWYLIKYSFDFGVCEMEANRTDSRCSTGDHFFWEYSGQTIIKPGQNIGNDWFAANKMMPFAKLNINLELFLGSLWWRTLSSHHVAIFKHITKEVSWRRFQLPILCQLIRFMQNFSSLSPFSDYFKSHTFAANESRIQIPSQGLNKLCRLALGKRARNRKKKIYCILFSTIFGIYFSTL